MKRLFLIMLITAILMGIIVIVQILIIKYRGTPVPTPDIPRDIKTSGFGEPLTYAIMGDSTSISQGSKYEDGIAAASTKYLASAFKVTSINTGISGATSKDVLEIQLGKVVPLRPDIVLLSVGANDATHFTKDEVIRDSLQRIIDELKKSNSNVTIIVTGSPAMDSVTRFPAGSRQIMGLRTRQVNAVFRQLIDENDLVFAPIAEKTRAAFIADPTLTASDKFHPNKRGYALWIPIVNAAVDEAVKRKGK
jgi:acyl-CoA thioesterase-1